jgi:H/ACA ribonucleoprotein complex subunit 2
MEFVHLKFVSVKLNLNFPHTPATTPLSMAKEKSTSPACSAGSSPSKDEDQEGAASWFKYDTSNLSVIASPLASEKLTKKLFKVVKKASKAKHLKRGIKEVVKAIRKGNKGIVMLAGDISPVDVITHIPVYCEENGIPYVYVPQKAVLGAAAGSKRPTSCLMIAPLGVGGKKSSSFEEYKEKYEECAEKIQELSA